MDRLFPGFLFRGHWKSLSIRTPLRAKQNWPVTITVYGLPLAVILLCWLLETWAGVPVLLQKPGAVLSAVALLAGGTLTAFTHLSTLRLRLTEREDIDDASERSDRDMVDEVAVHLVMAALFSAFTALLIILGITFASGTDAGTDEIRGPFAWVIFASLTFDALLYWIAFPRLYLTYLELNNVSRHMAGNHSGRD